MIVSNTTPISNLVQLDLLYLVKDLGEAVTIPEAVAKELDEGSDLLKQWRARCGKLVQVESVPPMR